MSQVRCCLCGEWTDDDIDRDMSTIQCRVCAEDEADREEDYDR